MASTAELAQALDVLAQIDPQVLGEGETIVALQRAANRLDALLTRATAAFDAAGTWEADGARSAAAWTATRCRLPIGTARRRVALGRSLRHLPVAEAAWLAGDISDAHVALLAKARNERTEEALAESEATLVEDARGLQFAGFVRAVAYWSSLNDPDGSDDESKRDYERRRLHLSKSFGGCGHLDGFLDPISLTIVQGALERIERELFEREWAEARRAGNDATKRDLHRSPAQRRADALVEMARRAHAMPAGARLPEPLFSVVVDYETFRTICELANGTIVAPGRFADWLDDAWVERVVFAGPSRPIDVGVRRRLFSGGTRRAVQLRDRACFNEFCDTEADECQVDHVQPWSDGGRTTVANGRLACGWHNRWRERHRRR